MSLANSLRSHMFVKLYFLNILEHQKISFTTLSKTLENINKTIEKFITN